VRQRAQRGGDRCRGWWPQGFVPEEDTAIKKVVADYQKASGNTIDLSITPFAPQRQKIVAAVQSGIVPEVFRNRGYCSPAEPGRFLHPRAREVGGFGALIAQPPGGIWSLCFSAFSPLALCAQIGGRVEDLAGLREPMVRIQLPPAGSLQTFGS